MKLFNKWDTSGITSTDISIQPYMNTKPQMTLKTQGSNAGQRFHKNKSHIVERLIMRLQVPGHKGKKHFRSSGRCTGKTFTTTKIVIEAFSKIEQKTNQNPIQVFIKALENSAPREEITTIEYGGARYPQAVDCAPQRRIDVALRMMVQGSYQASFGKKKKMSDALADEIMAAYNSDQKSTAISKKLEMERMADAAH